MFSPNLEDPTVCAPVETQQAMGSEVQQKLNHCRFCAQELEPEEMIDLSADKETMKLILSILEFFKIQFINLNNINLPKTTCQDCYYQITGSYTFFQRVREKQIILNMIYCVKEECDDGNVKIKSETESSNEENESNRTDIENYLEVDVNTPSASSHYPKYANDTPNSSSSTSIKQANIKFEKGNDQETWSSYKWSCKYCGVRCESMEDLRSHGMQLHKKCYAFKCADCNSAVLLFSTFNSFIEHVRQHRDYLRYYCAHCNMHFDTVSECSEHALTHWSNRQQICQWCGKICPDREALKAHKSMSQHVGVEKKVYRKPRVVTCKIKEMIESGSKDGMVGGFFILNWDTYEWACQECLLRFPSVHLLRRHTQELHDKCFSMKCADCPVIRWNYRSFVTHVAEHRPYLKKHCPYCNFRIEDEQELKKHVDYHFTGSRKPCDECGQIFINKKLETQHYKQFNPVRRQKFLTPEDLTCDACNKVFETNTQLRRHRKIHDENRKKEHVCDTCGSQFYKKGSLELHVKSHGGKIHVCKVCDRGFSNERYLRNHVKTHLNNTKFICDHCGRQFNRKLYISRHMMMTHNFVCDIEKEVEKYKCAVCFKQFKTSVYLKNHMNIHTGKRYQCQNCEKTFTNWGNCNKHMIRIHQTTLAKTKATPQGRIPIDKIEEAPITAEVNKQWMEDVTKNKTPVKKKPDKIKHENEQRH